MTEPDSEQPESHPPDDAALADETPDGPTEPRWRGWWERFSTSQWGIAAWVLVATLVAVPLLYQSSARLGPGTVAASLRPALSGGTELSLPPVGSIDAPTHRAPVRFAIELREVDVLDTISSSDGDGNSDGDLAAALEEEIRSDLGGAVARLIGQLLVVAAVVGVVAAGCFPGRRSLRRVAGAAAFAPAVVLVLVAPAVIGFDVQAFRESPTFSGPLASADQLLSRVGSLETRFGSVDSRAKVISERLAGLYSSTVNDQIARSDGQVTLLHVSDLHLNAVGMALARNLAEQFDVDAVVDTGDITSFGFAPESEFLDQLDGFEVPYVVVAGNHDSQEIRDQLAVDDRVVYLDDDSIEVAGLTISGIEDPTQTALRRIPADELRATYEAQAPQIQALVRRTDPDLLLLHNPVMATPAVGKVPVVASGHIHRSRFEIADGTVLTVVGSSGANGLDNLFVDRDAPYEFQLLRFEGRRLVAVDTVRVASGDGSFELSRRLVSDEDRDASRGVSSSTDDLELESPSREDLSPEELQQVTTSLPVPGVPTTSPSDAPSTTTTTTAPATNDGGQGGGP